MKRTLTSLAELATLPHDTIIDVRSPAEYAEDHIPGAINLPALTNEQRAEVGTIYVQDSAFRARKIGAAMVARNVASYLDGPLADKTGGWQPLVYCWRGGQRSGSVASILSQIGWRTELVEGGYQSYRALVVASLYRDVFPCPVVLLDGNTGSAKTELLRLLAERGTQVIDLEGLANHRGSLFGANSDDQPAQKGFETALATAVTALDPTRPVVIEAESSKVGDRIVPPSVWSAMRRAPRLCIEAPLAARAAFLVRAYDDIVANTERLTDILNSLRPHHAAARIDDWIAMAAAGETEALAACLMAEHYDPRYNKGREKQLEQDVATTPITLDSLTDDALAKAADRIAAKVG